MNLKPVVKMQSGGGMPPFTYYVPLGMTSPVQTDTASVTSSELTKSSSEGITDKDVLKMVGDIDALPSDTNKIINGLSWIYRGDNLFSNGRINASNISSRYLQALKQVKNAAFSRKEYDSAFETVQENGGLNEIAISNTGKVVVQDEEGNMKQISPDEYLNNQDKYFALKNSDLLYLRAHNDQMAGKNEVFNVVKNGIGMSAINKAIQDTITKIGSTTVSKEGYAHKKGDKILQGLEHLQQLVNEGADLSGLGLDGIYKTGLLSKSQMQQAADAVRYIASTLDTNAMTLLELKSGNKDNPRRGALDLITTMVTSQLDNTVDFKLNFEDKLTKDANGTGDDGSGGRGELKQLDAIASGIATQQKDFILNPHSNYQLVAPQSNWWTAPQDVETGKSIGSDTLASLLQKSGFDSLILQNSIYFGSDKVDPTAASSVIVDPAEGVAQVWLPYTETSNGGIAPNYALLDTIKRVEDSLSRKGNVSDLERRQAYKAEGIEQYWNVMNDPRTAGEQGLLRPFLAMTGVAPDTTATIGGIVTDQNKAVDKLRGDEEASWKKHMMEVLNSPEKNAGKKGHNKIDSWYEWEWLGNTSDMFRGTILMPLAGDRISVATRTGNINLPKPMFDARRVQQRGQIQSNFKPMGPTNFNK